ncbi:hypothetical protein HK102_004973 [Quaeritorhiza haematococci]|nr:hypothetical protein HK102_004973 [Quaeritorhiza haematococci]
MFPAETWSEIGGWLSDYSDFSNLAVALGVKWSPGTQAQRMIRKYGDDFLEHVAIGDELAHWDSGATRSDRRYILFSPQQMDFYRYLLRRMPEVVELLVEKGIIGDHNFYADAAFIEKELFYDPFLLYGWIPRLIRWGIPMDLDSLLRMTVEYTTTEYEPLEIDRIYNKFDPRTQFQAQTFIQQLLDFGADPNVLVGVKTPTDPVVTEILLQHGADPSTLSWPRSGWIWGCEKDRISLWCQYGWLPTVDDADLYFSCLLNWKRWDLVDVFLRHFKRNLVGVVEKKGLSIAIKARQLDLVKRMVTTFLGILGETPSSYSSTADWYVETDWKLDFELIEMVLSAGCVVDGADLLKCIKGNQRDIARKAFFQPKLFRWPHFNRVKDGPAWALKLIDDLMCLVFREDRAHYRYRFTYYGDFGEDVCRKCFE